MERHRLPPGLTPGHGTFAQGACTVLAMCAGAPHCQGGRRVRHLAPWHSRSRARGEHVTAEGAGSGGVGPIFDASDAAWGLSLPPGTHLLLAPRGASPFLHVACWALSTCLIPCQVNPWPKRAPHLGLRSQQSPPLPCCSLAPITPPGRAGSTPSSRARGERSPGLGGGFLLELLKQALPERVEADVG